MKSFQDFMNTATGKVKEPGSPPEKISTPLGGGAVKPATVRADRTFIPQIHRDNFDALAREIATRKFSGKPLNISRDKVQILSKQTGVNPHQISKFVSDQSQKHYNNMVAGNYLLSI